MGQEKGRGEGMKSGRSLIITRRERKVTCLCLIGIRDSRQTARLGILAPSPLLPTDPSPISALLTWYLPSAVRPTTELEIALLIVKREPCNVYLAGALKDAWRYIEAAALAADHHVGLEGAVELLVRADGGRRRRRRRRRRWGWGEEGKKVGEGNMDV